MGEVRTMYDWSEAEKVIYKDERPIGIVVMCADFNTKNRFVYNTLEKVFSTMICVSSGVCSVDKLQQILEFSKVVCVSLTPTDSGDHAKRHTIVTMLRDAGVRKVHGVYLRVKNAEFPDTKLAVTALEADPPTVDGLDGLTIL